MSLVNYGTRNVVSCYATRFRWFGKAWSQPESFSGTIGGGEAGRWTVEIARELGLATPVIEESPEVRSRSANEPNFATKVVSALRHEYGCHEEEKS